MVWFWFVLCHSWTGDFWKAALLFGLGCIEKYHRNNKSGHVICEMKCGHYKFCVKLMNHFETKTMFKSILQLNFWVILQKEVYGPQQISEEIITSRYQTLWSCLVHKRLNINLTIAEATKVEEKDLEVLVDDAGRNGMSTTDAITYIGIFIFCCFILACCAIFVCKK